jgi:predicted nucleotidyltransferase
MYSEKGNESTTLVRSIFGSHLYGLSTPRSDQDFKEVFVPSLEKVLLHGPNINQNISTKQKEHAKNTNEDIDLEKFSLGLFINHLCNGEMIAIDMLHSEPRHWIQSSKQWEDLVKLRPQFYSKSMNSYTSYIRKQVAKYSFKGSRLNILQEIADEINLYINNWQDSLSGAEFVKWVNNQNKGPKLLELKHVLPINEHTRFTKAEGPNHIEIEFYEVFGSKYMLNDYAKNVYGSITKYLNEYGKRAKLAAENAGVDWKAVSHAYRACYQLIHIYEDGGFTYPLKETDEILKVKLGEMDYKNEVEPKLTELYNKALALGKASKYPEQVDPIFRDKIQLDIYNQVYKIQWK